MPNEKKLLGGPFDGQSVFTDDCIYELGLTDYKEWSPSIPLPLLRVARYKSSTSSTMRFLDIITCVSHNKTRARPGKAGQKRNQ